MKWLVNAEFDRTPVAGDTTFKLTCCFPKLIGPTHYGSWQSNRHSIHFCASNQPPTRSFAGDTIRQRNSQSGKNLSSPIHVFRCQLNHDERNRLATFLTAELDESLKLAPTKKTALFSYIQNRLAQGATFNDAMKFIAQNTETEANDIKATLSLEQRQLFDQVYGADGVLLFSYPKAVALGTIGP
jgi:hypothetical protein